MADADASLTFVTAIGRINSLPFRISSDVSPD
jgi:hypothetical protein